MKIVLVAWMLLLAGCIDYWRDSEMAHYHLRPFKVRKLICEEGCVPIAIDRCTTLAMFERQTIGVECIDENTGEPCWIYGE